MVHILIDLSGHTRFNRLPTFALKPTPVQISWLGYFASTGVPGMNYLPADRILVPNEHRCHFSEEVVNLPDTWLCYTLQEAANELAVSVLPALKNGFITFGCFQNLRKLNDRVLALWGRVMQALPSSRIFL